MYCLSLLLLLFYFPSYSFANQLDNEILEDIHRVLQKRDISDNIAKDDPKQFCRNGGIYAGGICHCIHPHTGTNCEHFECVHGISVGFRYDPESLLFSAPCICDEGWKGELCNYKPVDKCGNRGEWKVDRCECIGFFFGSECQYTSRCVEGYMKHGRCICNEGFEGDYCDRIVCDYGSPNFKNRSLSCICPDKYTGRHCSQCKKQGPLIERFPVCTMSFKKKKTIEMATELRKKQKSEVRKRIWIISLCIFALVVAGFVFCIGNILHRNANQQRNDRNTRIQAERHRLLTNNVRLQKFEEQVAQESLENVSAEAIDERRRRKSEPSVLRTMVKPSIIETIKLSEDVKRKPTQ